MKANKISRKEAKDIIDEFFLNLEGKGAQDILKIKKFAMKKRIKLRGYRQLFCKKCFRPYTGEEKIRVSSGHKNITCLNCGYVNKIRIGGV